MNKNEETIRELLKSNAIVVETRHIVDASEREACADYYVWYLSENELISKCVSSEILYGDEAHSTTYNLGYRDGDSKLTDWSHSKYDVYSTGAEYDAAGWFFVQEPTDPRDDGKYTFASFEIDQEGDAQ